ncbi:PAS domain S-box protein [Haloplanus halophilus]|uniref:PAS domain S-box protein n=1 Tax=Haloplanus halophilus TaxID=2949993 RepID=UPI0031B7EC8B
MSTEPGAIRVLHVDDSSDFAELTASFLEREDDRFDVETATTSDAALARLEETSFDCIVSDYDMPERNGIEFLGAVREEYADLPFILFTGKGSEEVASDAISAGVTDYLQKEGGTGQYTVLANRIENAVSQYRSQRELEASQQRLSLFIEQSPLGVIEYDSDFEIVRLNEAGEEILGYAEAELRGETWEKIVAEDSYDDVDEVTSALARGEGGYHSIDENVRADGEHILCEWHNRVVTDENDDVVAVFSQFQDVTDREERQRRIEALHEATRELMTASTCEAVAERAVETAREVLDLRINSVYLYDGDADVLEPAAITDEAVELIGEPPTYEAGESLSWEAFHSGEVRVFEDVSTEPGRYNADTVFGSEIILPLGDHGVMYVAATEVGAFDEADVTLARMLAANTETALSRIERERTLRESQHRYRTLVENFPNGAVFLFDADLEYVLAGGEGLSAVGLSSADVEGATPHDLFPEDVADDLAHHYREALAGRSNTFEQEYRGERYRIRTLPVRDDGEAASGIAVSQRITERKERERELRRYMRIVNTMQEAACIYDEDGRFAVVNEYLAEFYDTTPEELEGERSALIPKIRAAADGDPYRELPDGDREEIRGEVSGEFPGVGEEVVAYRLTPLVVDGAVEAVVGVAHEVTEKKERMRELERRTEELEALNRRLQEQYRYLFEEAPIMGVVTRAEDGRPVIEDCNRRFAETVGHEKQALLGRELAAFYTADSERELLDQGGYDRALTGEFVRESRTLVTADGETVETLLRAVPRTDVTDDVIGTFAFYVDVSERKELEREKERLDEFTSIVSHDLRSPLNVAKGQAELARETGDFDHLDAVIRAHERMESLIDDLLTLARSGQHIDDVESVPVGDLAENCWLNTETNGATLDVRTERTVRADRSRLQQLLENLLRNAVEHGSTSNQQNADDAVEHSSTSNQQNAGDAVEHSSTSNQQNAGDAVEHGSTDTDDDVTVTVGALDGDGFYVADDGPGIPEDEREDVFDAGHTTSTDGTGFGLSIVEQVVEAHGWTIEVTESAAGGARFEITGVDFVDG